MVSAATNLPPVLPIGPSIDPNLPISSRAAFDDDVWWVDLVDGATERFYFAGVPIRWRHAAKLVVLSALIEAATDGSRSTAAIRKAASGMPAFFRMLEMQELVDLASAQDQIVDDIVEDARDETFGGRIDRPSKRIGTRWGTAVSLMAAAKVVVDQSETLRSRGFDAFPPHVGMPGTVEGLAKEITCERKARVDPLPDEVVDAVATVAHALLGEPAEDALRRVSEWYEASGTPQRPDVWRQSGATERLIQDDRGRRALKSEILLIVAACDAAILLAAGMRTGEYLSLKGGTEGDRTPSCLVVRQPESGLRELFFVAGSVFKQTDEPTREEWLIGSRFVGEKSLPHAVRALVILERIRGMLANGIGAAIETMHPTWLGTFLPRPGAKVQRRSGTSLRINMRRLYELVDWGALPDVGRGGVDLREIKRVRGRSIRPTHYRKTMVSFLLSADGTLRGALARHLKHMSLAETDKSYAPPTLRFQAEVTEARTYELARFFIAALRGSMAVAGPGVDAVRPQIDAFRVLTAGMDAESALEAVFERLRPLGVGLRRTGPLGCLGEALPTRSVCRRLAGLSPSAFRGPVRSHATPSTCSGCECSFADRETVAEATHRYVSARRSHLLEEAMQDVHADARPRVGPTRVAFARAAAARAVLEELRAPVPRDEDVLGDVK